ncbi:MAG TPA: ABC transporter permease [Acidimicrobiia bacterium]|nr:ABC transporter permease [Acidimicrobiia bacterium]
MIDAFAATYRQTRWERKMFWRNPALAGFTFAFPLMFLVIYAAINGNDHVHLAHGTARFAQYYVPAILAFGLVSSCYTNLAFTISVRRDRGVLKRVRGTPLPPFVYIAGIVGNAILSAAILSVLTIGLGVTAYGVTLPHRYLALALTILLAAFCFTACGAAIATFIPNEDAAPAIVNFVLFPLLFISGAFGTIANSSAPGRVAAIFPIRHLVLQLAEVFDPSLSGSGLSWFHVGVLLAWGVFGIAVAALRFRWEPRPS